MVRISRNRENLTVIESTTTTTMTNRSDTLSWCQRVVRISRNRENLTVIESTTTTTTTPVNSRRNLHTHSISRGFSRGIFRLLLRPYSYSHSILET